jgi:hypothetical protein
MAPPITSTKHIDTVIEDSLLGSVMAKKKKKSNQESHQDHRKQLRTKKNVEFKNDTDEDSQKKKTIRSIEDQYVANMMTKAKKLTEQQVSSYQAYVS